METDTKDKEFEISLGNDSMNGSIKFKNINNRVVASIGDIIVDKLSFYRWNNALKLKDKYDKKKAQRNLKGKENPLPPKFLIEIFDNAIQEDDYVQDQWCNLLINWQDIEKNCDKKYMYIELLKNLSINEIHLLKLISGDPSLEEAVKNKNYYYEKSKLKEALHISDNDYELMILNLFRLKICDSLKSSGNAIMLGNIPVLADAGTDKIRITIIGYNLLKSISE